MTKKPLPRRDFFRQLMLGALDKAEASSKALGGKIAQAVRTAQIASDKDRAHQQAQEQAQTQDPSHPHPVSNNDPIIRRPDNHISRGSINHPQDADTPSDPTPAPPEEPPGARSTRRLRPPGALPEPDFSSTCSSCGQCASVCPASCIILDTPHHSDTSPDPSTSSPTSAGAPGASGMASRDTSAGPYIIARESACTACESIACTHACPTGALLPLNRISQISIGIAIVYHPTCLRTPTDSSPGENCQQCIAPCPIGESAIGIHPQTSQIQIRPGCIGCGLCEQSCPTDPTSIYIKPNS